MTGKPYSKWSAELGKWRLPWRMLPDGRRPETDGAGRRPETDGQRPTAADRQRCPTVPSGGSSGPIPARNPLPVTTLCGHGGQATEVREATEARGASKAREALPAPAHSGPLTKHAGQPPH